MLSRALPSTVCDMWWYVDPLVEDVRCSAVRTTVMLEDSPHLILQRTITTRVEYDDDVSKNIIESCIFYFVQELSNTLPRVK